MKAKINGVTWTTGDKVEMIENGLKGTVVNMCPTCPKPITVLWANGTRRPMRTDLIRKV